MKPGKFLLMLFVLIHIVGCGRSMKEYEPYIYTIEADTVLREVERPTDALERPEEKKEEEEEIFDDCTCYCIARYRAPIPSPNVSYKGFPIFGSDRLGFRNIKFDYGEEMWDGDVNQKDYSCATKIVTAVTTIQAVLPRYIYYEVSVQNGSWKLAWAFGFIPYYKWTWGPWVVVFRLNRFRLDRDILSSVSFSPWCPDDGVSCP